MSGDAQRPETRKSGVPPCDFGPLGQLLASPLQSGVSNRLENRWSEWIGPGDVGIGTQAELKTFQFAPFHTVSPSQVQIVLAMVNPPLFERQLDQLKEC
jgi:hypothetical protein